ncbi:MAG TPA: serine/threonine-protein kinase [Candidatus Obscuribacterales bacterium]
MGHDLDLPDKEYEISYRTTAHWFVPVATATTVAIGAFAIFGAAPYLIPGLPVVRGALYSSQLVLETFIRCIVLLLLGFLTFLISEIARHDRLVISRDGISFPLMLAPDLLFRRKRSWDDIGNILLGAMLLEDRKGTYEYELEESKDKKKLFIYFKSGGHACLDLAKMPKKSVEKLFVAIESWCLSGSRSPLNRDEPKAKDGSRPATEVLTYTQLWEEQLESHFSATNFVPLEKGSTLSSNRLTVLMQLASGGLSACYLAEQSDKQLVVVKEAVLPPTLSEAAREKARALFAREAKLLSRLSHPQIAKVLDHFTENGRDYLILQFVPGHTLRQIVTKQGPQAEERTLALAKQLANILDFLHTQEPPIIHRDITPDNLVLRDDEQLVVIDFGAANEFVGTATGTLIGKQAYIAPEQFRGKAQPASDIYAAGGTLHYVLTGKDPTPLSVSRPSAVRSDLSAGIDEFIAKLTAVDVTERVGSAAEMYECCEAVEQADHGQGRDLSACAKAD